MAKQMPPGQHCVFCGQVGSLTKEHVWPQWLRGYPAYQRLIEHEKGAHRPEAVFAELTVDDRGAFVENPRPRGRIPLLPHVQVRVCAACNNGWMAQLEARVKASIDSWLRGKDSWVSESQAEDLALWVCKTAMTYGMWQPDDGNPFRPEDYIDLFTKRVPIQKMRIWVAFAQEPTAQVAMSLRPFWYGSAGQHLDSMPGARPNVASFYMAAHCTVFFMHYWRGPDGVDPLYDLPPRLLPGLRRVWPDPKAVRGPLAPISGQQLDAVVEYLTRINDVAGLPWVGNTPDGMREAYERWMAGEDARDLRREFGAGGDCK